MTEQNTTQDNPVAALKERVYTRALELTVGTYHRGEVEGYLRELGLVPTLVFPVGEGETVESVNAAVYAKLEELGQTHYAEQLGLERPGTKEVTLSVTFRLSPEELESLTETGDLPRRQPVRVSVNSDTEPTKE